MGFSMRFALVGCSNFCDRPLIYCVVADKIGQVRRFLVTKIVTILPGAVYLREFEIDRGAFDGAQDTKLLVLLNTGG